MKIPFAPFQKALRYLDLDLGLQVEQRKPEVIDVDKPSPPTLHIFVTVERKPIGQSMYRRLRRS